MADTHTHTASSFTMLLLKMNNFAIAPRVRYQNISILADLFYCEGLRMRNANPTWNVNEAVHHCQSTLIIIYRALSNNSFR